MTDDRPRWADVPGYGGRYQASTDGRVRQVYKDGRPPLVLKPYLHKPGGHRNRQPRTLLVRLIAPDGRKREQAVLTVISRTWKPCPEGMVAIHRNGVFSDNGVDNIKIISRREIGITYGRNGRRRCVAKIDRDGNVLECYGSAREAARANYMSLSAVTDRCNGVTQNPWWPYGTSFKWEEKKSSR